MKHSRFLGGVGGFLVISGLMLAGAEYPTNSGLIIGGLIGVAMMISGVVLLRRIRI